MEAVDTTKNGRGGRIRGEKPRAGEYVCCAPGGDSDFVEVIVFLVMRRQHENHQVPASRAKGISKGCKRMQSDARVRVCARDLGSPAAMQDIFDCLTKLIPKFLFAHKGEFWGRGRHGLEMRSLGGQIPLTVRRVISAVYPKKERVKENAACGRKESYLRR